MSSDPVQPDVAVAVHNLGKCYHIYPRPQDRLKQALWRGRRQFFKEFWALRGVCFEVRRGETLGIIGRNGSGKSTLLQIIAGTLTPAEGEARVNGRVAALLELGSGFSPDFTGRENVYMNGSILGIPHEDMERRFDDIAAFADIGEFIDQPVKTYSSGMYVRLAFAVAVSVKPEILVVDEALAVGDIFFQQKCARHMQKQMAGATKLLVTHDMQAVTTLADRVLVLDRGRLLLDAPPLEAVEYYTKLVHNEEFRVGPPVVGRAAGPAPEKVVPGLSWIEVKDERTGGAGETRIERVAIAGARGAAVSTVRAGDLVVARMVVNSVVPKRHVIFGYMINDRLGNAIFGETTCSLRDGLVALHSPGRYLVRLEFKWPEIQPGKYTITLGIGEGTHPLNHVIQCWAHNVAAFSAICPTRAVHCLFNNPIVGFEVSPVDRSRVQNV